LGIAIAILSWPYLKRNSSNTQIVEKYRVCQIFGIHLNESSEMPNFEIKVLNLLMGIFATLYLKSLKK
jgi:hypothetical protein